MRIFFRFYNLWQKLAYTVRCKLIGMKGAVFVFHEVSNSFDHDESCKIRQSTFREIIERLSIEYKVITTDEFFASDEGNTAVITFDDVPLSFYTEAYPILKEKGLPFTLFIAKKFVGMEGFLSSEVISDLDKDPLCTIGAHTCNHIRLRGEKVSLSDIEESKKFLVSLLGHSVDYFAYPFGRYDSVSGKNRKEVKACGFKAAFSTIPTAVPRRYNRWFIPRIELIR